MGGYWPISVRKEHWVNGERGPCVYGRNGSMVENLEDGSKTVPLNGYQINWK